MKVFSDPKRITNETTDKSTCCLIIVLRDPLKVPPQKKKKLLGKLGIFDKIIFTRISHHYMRGKLQPSNLLWIFLPHSNIRTREGRKGFWQSQFNAIFPLNYLINSNVRRLFYWQFQLIQRLFHFNGIC